MAKGIEWMNLMRYGKFLLDSNKAASPVYVWRICTRKDRMEKE